MKISRIRGWFALLFIVGLTCLALIFPTGFGTFSAYGVGYIASVCPVGALESMLGSKAVSLYGVLCLCITVILILLFGKFLCSWICPTPWIQKLFAKRKICGGDRCGGEPVCKGCALPPHGGERDGLKLDTRHFVLGGALLSSLVFGFPVFCLLCPVGLTFATGIGLWHLFQYNETTWGLLIYPAIILIEIVALRGWCFKFCPISALASLISTGNIFFRPAVDESKCLRAKGIDCHICVSTCPEKLDPHSAQLPECSKCHMCAEVCPSKAISFPFHIKKDT